MLCAKPYTNDDKWVASIMSGLLFLVIASPFTYGITNGLTSMLGFEIAGPGGCPNVAGVLFHGVVFTLLLRALMIKDTNPGSRSSCTNSVDSKSKWLISVMGGLLFVLVSSPFLYDTVNMLTSQLGINLAVDGCPNTGGVIVHALVFTLLTRLFMK